MTQVVESRAWDLAVVADRTRLFDTRTDGNEGAIGIEYAITITEYPAEEDIMSTRSSVVFCYLASSTAPKLETLTAA